MCPVNSDDLNQLSELLDTKFAPIYDTLGIFNKTLEHHGELLIQHGEVLIQHGKVLESHGKILLDHTKILKDHTKLLKQHTKLLKDLKRNQDIMVKLLDGEQMEQRKRIKRIEEHLDLPSSL